VTDATESIEPAVEAPAAEEADTRPVPASSPERQGLVVSVSSIAWAAAVALFLLLRLGTIWHAPVAGAELVQLSGAWQARSGIADARFVPTLFQALTTLLLHISSSDIPARTLAFLATATVPGAIFLLRGRLGQAGALLALVILAFDGPAITLGTSASAMGFDLAITVWLFVAMDRDAHGDAFPRWILPVIGFLAVTSGPLVLPLVAAWAAVRLIRADYPQPVAAAWCALGVVAGVVLATVQFGIGVDGLRIPPFALFANSYDQTWSTATALEMTLLYGLPVLLAGVAAAVVLANRMNVDRVFRPRELILLAWAGFALVWLASSANAHSAVPLVALTTPMALLVGPFAAEALGAMVHADWRYGRYLIPFAAFTALLALAVGLKWAHADAVGPADQQILVFGLGLIAIASLALLASQRESWGTLTAAALAVAVVPFLSGGLGVGLSAASEPSPSPYLTGQAHELRDIALQTAATNHGTVVIHPDLADAVTWPFRDSGSITIASRVPDNAAIVIWPASQPAPAGYTALTGDWALIGEVSPPTADFLTYLRWVASRGTVKNNSQPVAVYLKAKT